MTEPTLVVYDVTFFESDGETPLLGSAYLGEITESDFQVPCNALPHAREHLDLPLNAVASETDFIEGSSKIGSIQIRILDELLLPILARLRGARVVFRRYIAGQWRVRLDGVVYSTTPDPETVGHHLVELNDGRQFERNQRLFFSNHVLFGYKQDPLFGAISTTGPAIDYGRLQSGGYLLNAIEPYPTTFSTGILSGLNGLWWGVIDLPDDAVAALGKLGNPVFHQNGLWVHEDYQVWWRPVSASPEPYRMLRNMVRPPGEGAHAITPPNGGLGIGVTGSISYFHSGPTLFVSSNDEDEIPTDGEEIEILILAVEITEDTPFWWDGGTLGDLLQEIVDGDHTDEPPRERYSAASLAEFATNSPPGRFVLKKPVTDRRRWVEENIYQPSLSAPAPNENREIRAVSWESPDAQTAIPILDGQTLQPIGDLISSIEGAYGAIEFTYIRERLEGIDDFAPWERTLQKDAQDLARKPDWQRLIETEVTVPISDPDAAPGAEVLKLAPVTIRSTGSGAVRKYFDVDETGNQTAKKWAEALFPRRSRGQGMLEIDAVATDENLLRLGGDFVRLRAEWLPDEDEGVRGLRELAQILAIYESEDPSKIRFLVEMIGIPDLTADDDETGTGTGGEDCLTGGTLSAASGGLALRTFRTPGRHYIENTCDHAVTVGLVVVAGGGGGGAADTGGGAGAGGVLGGDGALEVVIPALSTVAIDVGDRGDPAQSGEDTTVWLHRVTGDVMDPDTDDPADAYTAIGGGKGGGGNENGSNGGSGGGGGAELPISGGGTQGGGAATAGQGSTGGSGEDAGGSATCQASAGGGGGSFGGPGTAGDAVAGSGESEPGEGGPATTVPGWSITLGGGGNGGMHDNPPPGGPGPGVCGPEIAVAGSAGAPGWGYGGGGAADGGGASGGGVGGVAFRYSGPNALLQPPAISSVETDDQNQAEICIEGTDWPADGPAGFWVRVDYAVSATEPDPSSGLWRFAGRLDAPGCLFTPPIPTGAKVWARARTEAPGYKPSAVSAAVDADAPETPGFLPPITLTVTPAGVATLAWTANAFSAAQKIRGLIHPAGDSTTRPLPLIDGTVVPGDSPYTLPDPVPEGFYITVDLEAWEDGTYVVQGHTERQSVQNPQRTIVRRTDGIDALEGVEITDGAPGKILQYDDYGVLVDREMSEALQGGDLLDGDPTHFLNGEGDFVALSAADGWTEIIASVDRDVTNSGTLADDAELTFPVVDLGLYHFDLYLPYSGSDATVDFKLGASFPSSTGQIRYMGQAAASPAINSSDGVFFTGVTSITAIPFGTAAAHSPRIAQLEGSFRAAGNGDFKIQFANNTPSSGTVSRRLAGALLRHRRIA